MDAKGNIPDPTYLPWYERNGATIEITWDLLPAGLGVKNWLFQYETQYLRQYKGYKCFWIRGWVRILGLFIGGGIFCHGDKLDGQ